MIKILLKDCMGIIHGQTDRQTFLFNIWNNQISGGREWPQCLRIMLPREVQAELHRRRVIIYRILYIHQQRWCRHNHRT